MTLWLIAGPEGVGKTTHARRYLSSVAGADNFVNLDEIARGYQPLRTAPDAETARAAGCSAIGQLHEAITARRSVAVETTLTAAHAVGMRVELIFCLLPDVETCLSRIAARVTAGGHCVLEADARLRYARAVRNFPDYAALVNHWVVLDTGRTEPRLVAHGPPVRIADAALAEALPLRWN